MELAHTVTCLLSLPVIPDQEAPSRAASTSGQAAGGERLAYQMGTGGGPFKSGRDDNSDDYWRALGVEVDPCPPFC